MSRFSQSHVAAGATVAATGETAASASAGDGGESAATKDERTAKRSAEKLREVSNFWEVDEEDVANFRVGMILNMLTEYTLKCAPALLMCSFCTFVQTS